MAYAHLAENLDKAGTEKLDIEIGMIKDPADVAKAELKAFQEAQGMHFDDPDAPVSADPTADAGIDQEY